MNGFHIGRSYVGNAIEQDCPCVLAPCGLVEADAVTPQCLQHHVTGFKTIRQMHDADNCPAELQIRELMATVAGIEADGEASYRELAEELFSEGWRKNE